MDQELTMSIRDISTATGLHPVTVRRLALEGKLPGAVRTHRGWRMSAADIACFVESGGARPQGRPVTKTENPHG